MLKDVLILSSPQDMHAHAMREVLELKGYRCDILFTPDFPRKLDFTINMRHDPARLEIAGGYAFELHERYSSVWRRRPYHSRPPRDYTEADRDIIRRECRDMRAGFFELLCPESLWVNPLSCMTTERCKSLHLALARKIGFKIPKTIFSNSPIEIVNFFKGSQGRVVYKTFNSLIPTTLLTEEMLQDGEGLRWTPGIYQEYIEKAYELRVTVVGRRVFTVRIDSQGTSRGKVDWREAQKQKPGVPVDLIFEPYRLSQKIEALCLELASNLQLAYAGIDLAVTQDGSCIFFEINSSGQFLWIDYETRLPILDAMSEMLVQGTVDFEWEESDNRVEVDEDFLKRIELRQEECLGKHVSEIDI